MQFLIKNFKSFPLLFQLINSQNMTFHIPFKFTNVDRPILSTLLRTNDQWQTSFDLLSFAGWAYCVLALLLKMSEFKVRIPICTLLPFGSLSWCEFRVCMSTARLRLVYMLYMRNTDLLLFVCYGYDFVLKHGSYRKQVCLFFFSLSNTVLVCCWLFRCDSDLLTICSITGGQDSLACECGCVCEPAYIRAGQGWVESKVSTDPQSALFLLSFMFFFPSK